MPSRPEYFVRHRTVHLNLVNHSSIAFLVTSYALPSASLVMWDRPHLAGGSRRDRAGRQVRPDAPHVLAERDEFFNHRQLMESSTGTKNKPIGNKTHRPAYLEKRSRAEMMIRRSLIALLCDR